MPGTFSKAFDGKATFLTHKLDTEHGLLLKLVDYKVLIDWQACDIKVQSTPFAKVERLIELLKRCDDCHFDNFIKALRETGQDYVANELLDVSDVSLTEPRQVTSSS